MKNILRNILVLIIIIFLPVGSNAQSIEPDFYKLLDNHGSVMLLIDSQTGAIQYANQAASRFYGYSVEEMKSMNISEINTLDSRETAKVMKAAVEENENYFVFDHKLANGDIRTVETYSYPYMDQGREMLFSIIHDITAKTELEAMNKRMINLLLFGGALIIIISLSYSIILGIKNKKLKSKNHEIDNFNELRRVFIDADNRLIYLKDENYRYIFVNKAFEKFYNKKFSEVVGKDDFEISNKEFAQIIRKTDAKVLERLAIIEKEVKWNNRIFKTNKFPIELLNGRYGVGAYIEDVTESHNIKRVVNKTLLRNSILVDVFTHDFSSSQDQLEYGLSKALELTESKFGYIYLYDEISRDFVLSMWSKTIMPEKSIVEKHTKNYLEKSGLWHKAVNKKSPIIVNDCEMGSTVKNRCLEAKIEFSKFITIPIVIDDNVVAIVGVANKEEEYDDNDIYQITVLMTGIWNAKERRETLVELAFERNKLLLTLISIGDGVMVVDLEGKIIMLNRIAEKLTGWTYSEAKGRYYKEVFVLSHEDGKSNIADPIEGVFITNKIQELGNHAMLTSKDGTKYHLEDSAAPIKDDQNNAMGVVLVFRDVTEKKEQRKKIEYLSYHDALTGLYNRMFYEEELKKLDTEENLPISVVVGDVNGLKLTNDIFGHDAGDMLLIKVAEVYKRVCRTNDIISRVGGDEFVILLPKTEASEAEKLMLRIKNELSKEQIIAIRGSISMGSDTKTHMEEDLFNIQKNAEDNMYLEKTLQRKSINTDQIKTIIETLYNRSSREEIHSKRVSKISESIGRAMELSNEEIKRLKDSGLFHDIGKVVLDKKLLNIDYVLTQQEMKEVRQHAVVGYRILNSFDETLDLAETVLAHHENWDGTGYPKGLKGKEIPKLARIIAVAENYEALTNEMTENAMEKEEAIEEIKKQSGKKFDPEIVNIFEKMILYN